MVPLSCCEALPSMYTTSISLLQRLRSRDDQEAWDRFVQLYTPMIYRWGIRSGLSAEAAGELVQDVLALLVAKLPDFRYRQRGSFRGWLRRVTVNRFLELQRRRRITCTPIGQDDLVDTRSPQPASFVEEEEYREPRDHHVCLGKEDVPWDQRIRFVRGCWRNDSGDPNQHPAHRDRGDARSFRHKAVHCRSVATKPSSRIVSFAP